MDRIVPNSPLSINVTGDNNYSSIDDSPEPLDPNNDFLPNIFETFTQRSLQRSLQFHHYGITGTPQARTQSPRNIVPTPLPSENADNVYHCEPSDCLVPDISLSGNYVLPNEHEEHNFYNDVQSNFSGIDLFQQRKLNYDDDDYYEWLPTKLQSDQSEAIDKALLCFSQCCYDKICKKGKDLIESLKKGIGQRNLIDCSRRKILEYLLEFHYECEELQCIAPGCSEGANTLEKLVECIEKESKLPHYSEQATFFSFSNNCCVKCPQDVKRTMLYAITSQNPISIYDNNYNWSKITLLPEIMQDVLPLLIKVGNLTNHKNILPIHWLIDDGNISYSTEHYPEPLKYKFHIPNMDKKDIILQLIEATLYLNSNEIAFLAWTSENIYYNSGRVMLANFQMGSALFDDFDSGLIKQLLFPTILPPELDSHTRSLEKADVWGVCCFLYELLTYQVVHSDLLHMERQDVWRRLNKNGWQPKYTCSDQQLQNIFNNGWKEQPEDRISLCELKAEIINYRRDLK